MLYMSVLTHDPSTCPGAVDAVKEKALSMGPRMQEVAAANGITLHGTWVSRAGHTTYSLVDAPDAHAIERAQMELGLIEWNTATTRAVLTIEDAMKELAEE